ncbi:MAG: aldehyde dehydrogenase family protein, partial [Vicinamibacterales bacterium]
MIVSTDASKQRMFVAGEWVDAASGLEMTVTNPATEEDLATVPSAGLTDVNAAVAAARAALSGPWGTMAARDRGAVLWRMADLMRARADELARLETRQNGKPLVESLHSDVPAAAECLQYYAGWADKIHGETVPVRGSYLAYTLREPLGVVAAIVPWNFPLLLLVWKVAPALACGNTVVVKPASLTPLTALALAEIGQAAGLPPGVLNVVTGAGRAVGQMLVEHQGVDKVAFTGSTEVGRSIMRASADTVKRLTLELGGKSANIVFADADLEPAVRGALHGIFYGKGEVCGAGSRVLVEASILETFLERLTARASRLQPGDPLDPRTRLGAVISREQLEQNLRHVQTALDEGATLRTGGNRVPGPGGRGFFMQPTIFSGVTPEMTLAREEVFGPVLAVIPFRDADEAVRLANASNYGLASGVWTRDIRKAHQTARRLQAGTVWVNTYHVYDAAMPFGGYKQSGFGRENGEHALEHYTQVKSVWVD